MRYLFLGHTGVGDHIILNALIHRFLRTTEDVEELRIVAADDYRKHTLIHLYEDYPLVTFYWLRKKDSSFDPQDPVLQQLDCKPEGTAVLIDDTIYFGIPFGLHSPRKCYWLNSGASWIDCLYKFPLGYDCEERFDDFRLPSDLSRASALYSAVCQRIGSSEYLIVHDDPSRNRNADPATVKHLMEKDDLLEVPVVYLGMNRYSYPRIEGLVSPEMGTLLEVHSLFDLIVLLRNAKACHLMDSSIACLVDCANLQGKLYMHNYINEASGYGFTRYPWVQVNKIGSPGP